MDCNTPDFPLVSQSEKLPDHSLLYRQVERSTRGKDLGFSNPFYGLLQSPSEPVTCAHGGFALLLQNHCPKWPRLG